MTGTEWEKIIVSVLGIGIIGKIAWNWLTEGRIVKEPVFVTTKEFNKKIESVVKVTECAGKRSDCCVADLKKGFSVLQNNYGKMDMRIYTTERLLEKGDINFKELRSEIQNMNILIASLSANVKTLASTMEYKIEKIVIKDN